MNETPPQKKVGLPLLIGIILFPIIFVWFTLSKRYTTRAKLMSFGYLIGSLIFLGMLGSVDESDTVAATDDQNLNQKLALPQEKSDFEIVQLDNLSSPYRKVWVVSMTLDHSLSDQREEYLKQIAKAVQENRGADFVAVRLYPNKYTLDWGFVLGSVEYSPDGMGYDGRYKGDVWKIEINDSYPNEDELNLLNTWYGNRFRFRLPNEFTDVEKMTRFAAKQLGKPEEWVRETYADLSEKYGREDESVGLRIKERRRKREAQESFFRQNGITDFYSGDLREFVESIKDGRLTLEEGKKLPIKYYPDGFFVLSQLVGDYVIYETDDELLGRDEESYRIAVVKEGDRFYGESSYLPVTQYLFIGILEFDRTIGGSIQLPAFKEIRY